MTQYSILREANIARQKEWDAKSEFSLTFKSTEAFGELGEALEKVLDLLGYSVAIAAVGGRASNIVKKLARERLGRPGSRASRDDLADELADLMICTDLLAMHEGINLKDAVIKKFNISSERLDLKTRMVETTGTSF